MNDVGWCNFTFTKIAKTPKSITGIFIEFAVFRTKFFMCSEMPGKIEVEGLFALIGSQDIAGQIDLTNELFQGVNSNRSSSIICR
jgi:hypothetical protein